MKHETFDLGGATSKPALVWWLPGGQASSQQQDWERLCGFSCGGFSCNTLEGFVRRVNVPESSLGLIERIANEEFAAGCRGESLDYEVATEHRAAYVTFLAENNLQAGNLQMLQQAVYPLAATSEVLDALGADHEIQPDGASLLVLGWNCD